MAKELMSRAKRRDARGDIPGIASPDDEVRTIWKHSSASYPRLTPEPEAPNPHDKTAPRILNKEATDVCGGAHESSIASRSCMASQQSL